MTTPPPESTTPSVAPTPEETRAINNAASDGEIRALAQQLIQTGQLPFTPGTYTKAIVTDLAFTGSPPTVSVNIAGDTTTEISGVRIMSHYSPVVGDTVLVAKQGADMVILGHIADTSAVATTSPNGNGWITATLVSGSHDGNSNGLVQYRRVLDHGSWKMQWRGGWNVSGTVLVSGLPDEYRPSDRRTLAVARTSTGGSNVAKFDFNTDGTVTLVGGTTTPNSASVSGDVHFSSLSSSTGSAGSHGHGGTGFAGDSHSHSHGGTVPITSFGESHSHSTGSVGSHSHSIGASHDHGFSGGSHTHTVSSPSWVSLNGVEYFL